MLNDKYLIAKYNFDDNANVGKDSSGKGNHGVPSGNIRPTIITIGGRKAAKFSGGTHNNSYIQLPENLLGDINDNTGLTVSTWVYLGKVSSVWERIFDFGKGSKGPYVFLTRNLRGVCFEGTELAADPRKTYTPGEWIHVALSITGTKGGTLSGAGPIVYVNGEKAGDGFISQTSSGNYAQLRKWFDTFTDRQNYTNNTIGMSQHDIDVDFCGYLSDFRVYKAGLTQDEVIDVMCDSLSDESIVRLAEAKYLSAPAKIVTKDIVFPRSLMSGKVEVSWKSDDVTAISDEGFVKAVNKPKGVTITAAIKKGQFKLEKNFNLTVLPEKLPGYTLNIDGNNEVLDISDTLYGLFYEDINNAADGGIYAELVKNRSFESFIYDTYSAASGMDAKSTGRKHTPLDGWSGDLDKVTVKNAGGLNEYFNVQDKDVNAYYITAADGTTIYNKGFADTNRNCSMCIRKNEKYDFTIWAKSKKGGKLILELKDKDNKAISNLVEVQIEDGDKWKKYGIDEKVVLTGSSSAFGKLTISFSGEVSVDMVSLIPEDVWGAKGEPDSRTAHSNYIGNPNYRLRSDLVKSLQKLHPTFLRFPGGCISEGSYIWENVYNWKESVGDVEVRKENYNVWGYVMTMGLGYMEYFQLSEDLNAKPLPVMACGVLCQARSDYANPAGGKLRDKYIKNFTDLIDFAISTDFESNKWAILRKKMGHVEPFDLHYLGVGNENWGTEFFANFEIFKAEIDKYMEKNYPAHELNIISTVGAQADDDAYQQGWKFLIGNYKGSAKVSFTDGESSIEENVSWYKDQKHYMETIADEHYYRSNDYLLNNADRYNYYYRAFNEDGSINNAETSKVFVGEYASTDKNTLAGAIAEAAVMTGFENNSDVVRLAATAPLFNKVLTDNSYRWTPDCIWFDDETVWLTPTYYVQQLFAKYIGKKLLATSFSTYVNGKLKKLIPHGGIEIAAGNGEIIVKNIKVTSNTTGDVLFNQDFTEALDSAWKVIPDSIGYELDAEKGLILKGQSEGLNGLYIMNDSWTNYKVEVEAVKVSGIDGFYVGVGLTDIIHNKKDVIEYAVGYDGNTTAVKVYKQGVEGYRLGDYSSSTAAGNLRACCDEEIASNVQYSITVNYGGVSGRNLICFYRTDKTTSRVLNYKLEAYNRDIFSSVTRDDKHLYIKLVNPDDVDKLTEIKLKGLTAAKEGKLISLTADSDLVNVQDVNKKNDEKVVPVENEIVISNNSAVITVAANSVNVLVMDI
ncbi:alpha-L-arabinofuranosidase C-terminal domain-containing protein [Clostridium oryzae]|uniref:non-reducing end alpha-L-arabinofuranosidase n=1 Tax=Clostridium oryzae TaxID=1450648 RepID=A0A1V4IPW8_9CLOT|nr:alpha-L-arabinofuranosidase C-terminal domain-containing protein [Clostridium oryzae]OPJ61929.1 extracellular exo-alpha-L-arabinofuranosidase precursor [Clostridium oryzae]